MKFRHPEDDRLERALEGSLSPEEWTAFQADVIRDPRLRAEYVDRLWLQAQLRADHHALSNLLEDAEPTRSSRWPTLAWVAVAAVLTFALNWAFFQATRSDKSVAILLQADNCKWAGSDLPTRQQSKLQAGTLELVEGIATLQFKSGATVTIEAPTTLEILNAMQCRLVEGSIVADVPEPAHGFTIYTPDMKVIDLGTRFGLTAGSAGNSHVFVFEGEVKIDGLSKGSPRRLTEGRAFSVASGNVPSAHEPVRFRHSLEANGWTSISTGFGQGKDAYARRDSAAASGQHPLLLVKHSELETSFRNERRILLTFDLSQVQPLTVNEAELVLDPEPSGFGFSALIPSTSRFAVYGIVDESRDHWDENTLEWRNFPAFTDEGAISGQARKLGEFEIPRGGSGEPLTVGGAAFANFIREDTNGLVSFVIVRETGEIDPSGLVHAFASKEHPSALPPTLRIR